VVVRSFAVPAILAIAAVALLILIVATCPLCQDYSR
jgi:hypothetical protein